MYLFSVSVLTEHLSVHAELISSMAFCFTIMYYTIRFVLMLSTTVLVQMVLICFSICSLHDEVDIPLSMAPGVFGSFP